MGNRAQEREWPLFYSGQLFSYRNRPSIDRVLDFSGEANMQIFIGMLMVYKCR